MRAAIGRIQRHACGLARSVSRTQGRVGTALQKRWLSGLDLDAILAANRYGADKAKPELDQSLDAILNQNRYAGPTPLEEPEVLEVAPEYPYDIDVGPLFCVNAERCFLDGGGRCGAYQSANRNKNMLQDLYRACKETGFFFVHNTNIDEATVKRVLSALTLAYVFDDVLKTWDGDRGGISRTY